MTFAHLTLATRDVIATRQFLENCFGWQPISRPGNIEVEAAWLQITPTQQVHLLRVEGFEPSAFEAEFGRHVALFHPASDFPALQQRLQQNGATLIEPERETPFERFFFRDPNGYMFEIIDQDGYCDESA